MFIEIVDRNPLLPATQSILEVQVFDRVLQKYMPLQTHQIYRIVTNNYLRGGGMCENEAISNIYWLYNGFFLKPILYNLKWK